MLIPQFTAREQIYPEHQIHMAHLSFPGGVPDWESKPKCQVGPRFHIWIPLLPAHMYRLIIVGNYPNLQLKI